MQSAVDRRFRMLEWLTSRRKVTIGELMNKFEASRSTIERDIDALTRYVPIFTQRGKFGGVYLPDNYHGYQRFLNSEQETLLRELLFRFSGKQALTIESILSDFARPAVAASISKRH